MKPRDTWEGQLESTTLSFDVVEEATASNATPGPITTEPTLINEYDRADKIDYIVAASCGVLTGLLDAFWIGEFSLKNAQTWGRDKTNKFVIRVAQMRGYKKDELEGAIRFLEKAAPMASDQLTSVWGGGLQHHFRDFAHHASIIGLIFSLMTQFTGMSYGTNTEGLFEIHELHDKSLIGRTFEEKLYNGIIMWMLHLISDMAGSSSSAGKGTGIPGPLLSLAKELSVLPGIRNLKVDYKDDNIGLSVLLSKIFNGTAFEHTSYKDITRFDLRTEMGIYAYNVKQNIPVIINQCAIRAFYFVRRLCIEISNCNIRRLSDLKRLNPSHFLPRNNKCIIRMATISSGVFVAVDASDAAIRTYLSGTRGKKEFITNLLLRTNFTGIGKFLIALKNDIYVNVFNNEWTTIQQPIQIPDSDYTIEDVAIDISVDVDSTGIYEYAFYRMFESVKKTKDDFSKAMSVDKDMQVALLQLEDEETRLYDTTVKMSQHSLIVETEYLLMRLLAFYGIAYTPYTGNERYSYYMPFYRIEDGKKIAYVFTPTITTSLNWKKIKEQYDVDGIKAVAMVELGPDADTRNTIVGYEIQKSDGFIDYITLRDLFSLISDDEYNVYKEFVEKYNTDVHKLIGYRTIVVPSEESLDKLKLNLETELRQLTFAQTMREENLYEGQAQTIECNFWDKGLYKALLGDSTFAESLLSSEWYYQTHGASSSALEQTAIVAGYLKSVEQLLYAVVRFSIDSGKTIKRKGYDRTAYVDYSFENESFVDYSLGSLIGYIRHYSDLWIVNSFAKNYVCDKLSIFRDKYRNDHFHKDNITSIEEIRDIRNYSLFMMYLILGALRIDEPHVEDLGIKNPTEEVKRKEGLSYSALEKWLDRILGGDVLLPVDSNIYFCVGVWGTEQWRLEFSTVSGFSDQGFPENSEWPYIGDDFKWDSCGEGKEEAEASVIEMLKRYMCEGRFAHNLKVYKTVSAGWFGKQEYLYRRLQEVGKV